MSSTDHDAPASQQPSTERELESAPHPQWLPPSPEAKAEAEPAKEALKEALQEIKTPERAEKVADTLIAAAGNAKAEKVRQEEGAAPVPAEAIQAAAATPGVAKAPATIVEAAKQVAGSSGEKREALEQAIQEATNPAQQGAVEPEEQAPLELLREALMHRMKPYQAIDARLFLAINHLPHTPLTNKLMYGLTLIMTGGWGWVLGLVTAAVVDKKRGLQALNQIVPPLWFATMTVEYPIKYYFRRRRPFISVVQAIAVGKKPGSYSFPSGHSAAAFAGAWLLRHHYPKLAWLWYTIAALVGFSRIYLGAHYPGDVLSGAVTGTVLAETTRWVMDHADEPVETHPTARALRKWF